MLDNLPLCPKPTAIAWAPRGTITPWKVHIHLQVPGPLLHPTIQVTFSSVDYSPCRIPPDINPYIILGYQTCWVPKHSGHRNSYNGSWRPFEHTHITLQQPQIHCYNQALVTLPNALCTLWSVRYPRIADQPLPNINSNINRPGWTLIHHSFVKGAAGYILPPG